jgi:transposase
MIRHLGRQGLSISEIARRTGRDRKTVRKMIKGEAQPVYKPRPRKPSKLDPFKTYVKVRMEAGMMNAVKMLKEIREVGYNGGISILKEFMGPHRRKVAAVQRYETPPGQQAQVDWGTCGKICDRGSLRVVYCFVMTLGYSRMMYVEFTFRCDTRAFIRCHINAFAFFGGVVKTCLYDNLKSVKLATLEDRVRLNPTFLDFFRHLRFYPKDVHAGPSRDQRQGGERHPLR